MARLLTVTFYKIKMMLSDKLFFGVMIVLPIFIAAATGFSLRYEKMDTIPIALVDEDRSAYSETLLERVKTGEGISVSETDRENALDMLEGDSVEQVYIIKKGFGEMIGRGEGGGFIEAASSPSSFSSAFTSELLAAEVMRLLSGNMATEWLQEHRMEKIADEAKNEILAYNDAMWEPEPLMTVDYYELEGKNTVEPVVKSSVSAAAATSTGLITAFVMFYMLFGSGWLVEERTNGTLKRLIAGSGALGTSYAGSILALLVAGGLQVVLYATFSRLISGVSLFPGFLSWLVFFVYILAVISISLFLSAVLKTQAQLQAIGPVLAMLTGFAGGCFWNFVTMPRGISLLSKFTPQGWALEAMDRLLLNPSDGAGIMAAIVVLSAISILLLPLGYFFIEKAIRN